MDSKNKEQFAEDYAGEIKPLLLDVGKDFFSRLAYGNVPEDELNGVLKRFETKIYLQPKPEGQFDENAQKVLVTVADPGAFNVIGPLIDKMNGDQKVSEIAVITHGVSQDYFKKQFGDIFSAVNDPDKPILAEITSKFQPDVIVVSMSDNNGPENFALFGGKSILGAKKLFVVVDGWTGMGSAFRGDNIPRMDEIDGVFCNDELAKQVVVQSIPNFPQEKIFDFGTPTTDSVKSENGEELARLGRKKLSLDDETLTVLYGGGIQSDWIEKYGTNPKIEEISFQETVRSLIEAANLHPDQSYALLVRPHPRDPEKGEIFDTSNIDFPENIKVIPADNSKVSFSEAVWAADVAVGIIGTENFKMHARGKKGIFLAFEGSNLGDYMLKKVLGEAVYNALSKNKDVTLIRSGEDLTEYLKDIKRETTSSHQNNITGKNSVDKILEIALG